MNNANSEAAHYGSFSVLILLQLDYGIMVRNQVSYLYITMGKILVL
jgi:hypothetical protein